MRLSDLSPKEIAALRLEHHRRKLRSDFAYFMDCELKRRNPAYGLSAGHRLLCHKLQALADGKCKPKLMCFCPSSWGKTTILSHGFPVWLFSRSENFRLIGASHNGDFAENKVSRPVREVMSYWRDDLCVWPVSDNVKEWKTNTGCEYRAAGVRAGILGERADGGIIDDPFGDMADAKSATIRDAVHDWYRGAWISRFPIGFPSWQILMHQRLHLDDLAGRLIEEEGDEWEVLHLPARFEGLDWRGNPIAKDELGRTSPGESIWPEVWTDAALTQREKEAGPYAFASMFQQRPAPPGGSTFKPAAINVIEPCDVPKLRRIVLAFDYAAGKSAKGDYTVGALLAETIAGGWIILDIARAKGGPDVLKGLVMGTAERHANKYGKLGFKIFLPQDGAAGGAYMVADLSKLLAGYNVEAAREGGDKELRATPLASQVNAGNVYMVRAPWNRILKDELEAFPSGKHDDQVDACSSAFNSMIASPMAVVQPTWIFGSLMAR